MARVEWGLNGRGQCSYKRITWIICFVNIVVALYVLHSLYSSVYRYPSGYSTEASKYTVEQIRKMEEFIGIRREAEPKELVKLLKGIRVEVGGRGGKKIPLPPYLRSEITDEILLELKSVDANASFSHQRDVVENWRRKKIEEVSEVVFNKSSIFTNKTEKARVLFKALKFYWEALKEDIGLWIPSEVVTREGDDVPESGSEFEEIIAGRPLPSECRVELHTDYGGRAVKWGLTHHKESAADCCQACLDQAKLAQPGENKCNIWVYCPLEAGCHSPDIYQHTHMECWLKYAEHPKLSFKNKYSNSYRASHRFAPLFVPWMSGVISP